MVDGEYRRLACTVSACDGVHKAHGYCLRHYRQWQRGGIKQDATNCAHCGGPFTSIWAGSMYCTKACKHAAWRIANPGKRAVYRVREAGAVAAFSAYFGLHCKHCGQAFGAKGRRRGHCSEKCERAAWYAEHRVSIAPPVRTCPVCSNDFSPSDAAAMQSRMCGPACVEKARRKLHSIYKRARKARMRGVHAEAVDPLKVFDRDGWKCQLCGVRTPKAKRGTFDPDAPELDHIVPLARGGEHTYRNTQCACRSCNGAKGAKPLGQLLLLG